MIRGLPLPALLVCAVTAAGATLAVPASRPETVQTTPAPAAPAPEDPGEALIVRHRCGACHADLPQPAAPAPLRATSPTQLLDGLAAPAHPNLHLSEPEALAIALAVGTADDSDGRRLRRLRRDHPGATSERGAVLATGVSCGACHAGLPRTPGAGPLLAPLVRGTRPEWLHAYLARPVAVRPAGARPGAFSRMPDFHLDSMSLRAITAYLARSSGALGNLSAVPAAGATAAEPLLDALSCTGCHAWRGTGGRIGPRLDDVAKRRTEAYIAAMIKAPHETLPGAAMPATIDARADRLAALLATARADLEEDRYETVPEAAVVEGATSPQYRLWCASCHGVTGRGDGWNATHLPVRPADHTNADTLSTRADDTLHDMIAGGGVIMGRSPTMPAFGGTLSPDAIERLVAELRRLCRCTQPEWAGR